MAGDLEDFLRRAAQRRQANAGGQPAAPGPAAPQKPQRPQYSNSRTERISRDVEDEIYVAEVVEEKPSPWQERQRKIDEAKRAAKEAESVAALALAKVKASNRSAAPPAPEVKMTGDVAGDLLRLLQSPEGIQQAVLLREILERPVDRW